MTGLVLCEYRIDSISWQILLYMKTELIRYNDWFSRVWKQNWLLFDIMANFIVDEGCWKLRVSSIISHTNRYVNFIFWYPEAFEDLSHFPNMSSRWNVSHFQSSFPYTVVLQVKKGSMFRTSQAGQSSSVSAAWMILTVEYSMRPAGGFAFPGVLGLFFRCPNNTNDLGRWTQHETRWRLVTSGGTLLVPSGVPTAWMILTVEHGRNIVKACHFWWYSACPFRCPNSMNDLDRWSTAWRGLTVKHSMKPVKACCFWG